MKKHITPIFLAAVCACAVACSEGNKDLDTNSREDARVRSINTRDMTVGNIPLIDMYVVDINDAQTKDSGITIQTIDGNVQIDAGDIEQPDSSRSNNFSQLGPYDIVRSHETMAAIDCASLQYSIYTPVGVDNPHIMVLGHGFARGPDVMVNWAIQFSSWGIKVLLPTLCHYNVFTGVDHEANGQNMVELASLYSTPGIIYAGHSAGGLAAIIAASQDVGTIGILGLDTTDTQDVPGVQDFIGQQYIDDVLAQGIFIAGEPSSCNANNNGLSLFRGINGSLMFRVSGSDHCDFENPTNFVCELNCGEQSASFSKEYIREAIVTLATAAAISFIDPDLNFILSLENFINEGAIIEVE